jgi:hypothetical protein
MLTVKDLEVYSTTYRKTLGSWIYEFMDTDRGIFIKRVPVDSPLWGHGISMQTVDHETRRFISVCCAGLPMVHFGSWDEALTFVSNYVEIC